MKAIFQHKTFFETILSHISGFLYESGTESYTKGSNTFFESCSIQEQILIHEHNYQQLYHKFFDSYSSQDRLERSTIF